MTPSSPVTAVAPDIYQVQIPLPFALRIVNCYLLSAPQGWTVVDTGLNTSAARETWLDAFKQLHIRPRQIEQIVLTHTHPDHYGLAGWLTQLCVADGRQPPVRLSAREDELARQVWQEGILLKAAYIQFWHQCGLPETLVQAIVTSIEQTRRATFPHPAQHTIIEPQQTIALGQREVEALHMPGHSDGQLVFYDRADRLLFCGDHVLQKITPNISLWPHGAPNPLGAYLDSLAGLETLEVRLALPGHYPLLTDFHGRIQEIVSHHHQRLAETLAALPGPATVHEVSQRLFDYDSLSTHEMRFATTETLAHLDYFVKNGRLQQIEGPVWHFSNHV